MGREVVLIELDFHNEVVKAIGLQLLSQNVRLKIATTPFVYDNIPAFADSDTYDIEWFIKKEALSNTQFLKDTFQKFSSADAFIINGFQKIESSFLDLDIPENSSYIIHDVHSIYEPNKNLLFRNGFINRTKDFIKYILFRASGEEKKNLKFIQQFKRILLPSKSVLDYIEKGKFTSQEKGVAKFAIHEKLLPMSSTSILKIVIPGTIIEKSRDYKPVLDAFTMVLPKLKSPIEIVLLGRATNHYGFRVVRKFLEFKTPNVTIKTYDKFISQDEFDKQLQGAHFLVLPMKKFMRFNFFRELNSQSCVSGNVNDMVRYGTPSLIPEYYLLDNELDKLVSRYSDSNELANLLVKWINEKDFENKRTDLSTILKNESADLNGKLLLNTIFP